MQKPTNSIQDAQPARSDALHVVSVVVVGGRRETEVLALAGSLACSFDHRLGLAILESTDGPEAQPRDVTGLQVMTDGASGCVDGHHVVLGTAVLFAQIGLSTAEVSDWANRLKREAQEVIFIAIDGSTAGVLGLAPLS